MRHTACDTHHRPQPGGCRYTRPGEPAGVSRRDRANSRTPPPAAPGRQTDDHRAHRPMSGRCRFCHGPAPAPRSRWIPPRREAAPSRSPAASWPATTPPPRPAAGPAGQRDSRPAPGTGPRPRSVRRCPARADIVACHHFLNAWQRLNRSYAWPVRALTPFSPMSTDAPPGVLPGGHRVGDRRWPPASASTRARTVTA